MQVSKNAKLDDPVRVAVGEQAIVKLLTDLVMIPFIHLIRTTLHAGALVAAALVVDGGDGWMRYFAMAMEEFSAKAILLFKGA